MRRLLVRGLLTFVVLLGVLYGVLALLARPAAAYPFFANDGPLVIAHQGGDGLWPGDTLYAFERAAALGVDVLEMDMHATADGVLVLMHDATIDRTTNGSGAIREMSFAALRTYDAGYNWSADDGATYPFRGQGIVVPTLEEVVDAFPDYRLNIEIKQQEPSIVAPFCAFLRERALVDQVLVASFHPQTMSEFRVACPEVATSAVEPELRTFYAYTVAFMGRLYRTPTAAFQVPEYSGDLQVVSERFLRNARQHNVAVHVWTVNETADMTRLLEMGVDGLITDRPDRLLALLGR